MFNIKSEPRGSWNFPKALTNNPDTLGGTRIMATATNTTIASARLPALPAGIVTNPIRDYRDAIWAHREALPSHELQDIPVRRFVASACGAEVKHAHTDFLRVIYSIGASPYFYGEVDPGVEYRYAHEARAGEALIWLSYLQTHDSDRRGAWERWSRMSPKGKSEWLARRRAAAARLDPGRRCLPRRARLDSGGR